ncbi:GDSL-type esterase/lipase family protein [Enterococcus casseliflavus]|nr:GDSL-type esterase/lipase family protein [Enterococcus casseliflavus]WEL48858.1 GDSL-type esterase/lipase family protein [Enterococcus casseliflavus]
MEKIVIVGDSTASIKEPSARPETGWGEKISRYLPQHQIVNLAKNGRSSKSFIEEGRLLQAKKELYAGDYLLIQFGHNDQKTDSRGTTPVEYQHNLATFVQTARPTAT